VVSDSPNQLIVSVLRPNTPKTASLVLPLSHAACAAATTAGMCCTGLTAHPHAYTLPSEVIASVCAAPQATCVT
jgi:hypothetical protein